MVTDILILNSEILSITILYKIHFHSLKSFLSLYLTSHLSYYRYVSEYQIQINDHEFRNDTYQHTILFIFKNIGKLKCIISI